MSEKQALVKAIGKIFALRHEVDELKRELRRTKLELNMYKPKSLCSPTPRRTYNFDEFVYSAKALTKKVTFATFVNQTK